MKIIRNDQYIERRSKIGRYTSLAALAVLAGGMLISFVRPQLITIAFVCLLVGFTLSMVGIYYGNRFARPDRPDIVLARALKGLDDRYYLYHYRTPTPHVLVGPDTCYVLNVQMQSGKIVAQGNRWKQSLGWRRLFMWMGQESIGNPAKTAQVEADTLDRFLEKHLPDIEVPLTPVVVFSDPNIELDVADTLVPVVHIKQLKDWVRGEGKRGDLKPDARKALLNLLGREESPSSPEK